MDAVTWAAGYVAGWERSDAVAALDGRPEPEPGHVSTWRALEQRGRRVMWDSMVLAGEYPDPEVIEQRLQLWIIEHLRREQV